MNLIFQTIGVEPNKSTKLNVYPPAFTVWKIIFYRKDNSKI